jgi:two-component system phosphate regulon response regulator PhoB
MQKKTIFVLDEEEDILELVKYSLTREGFQVVTSKPENDIFELVIPLNPNLIIINFIPPVKAWLGVLKKLKQDPRTGHLPVVVLTTENYIEDEISALDNGADDYITKPFSPRIMAARIKAVLRSKENETIAKNGNLQVGDIEIDPNRRVAIIDGSAVELTYSEFETLLCLAKNTGWVLSRDNIIDAVHGTEYSVADRSVDVLIYGLRKKLGPYGRNIETVRGIGYRLNA